MQTWLNKCIMAKQDTLTVSGTIIELLPNANFRVKLENDLVILSHLSGRMRMNNISVRLGDRVDLEMSMYDTSKGRIIFRHKPVSMSRP